MTRFNNQPVSGRHQPKGFRVLYEDDDIIVGNKAAGLLTVAALYERERTVHQLLNLYVRKGNSRSHRCVYVVHRLDRETSGILIFARSETAQQVLKNNWPDTKKTYYAVVHGRLARPSGLIESYLIEDDKYRVHSLEAAEDGKLARTAYKVIKATAGYSLLEIDLLTGRKNQIRVHMAHHGHPLVGDTKYGRPGAKYPFLALHAYAISFPHPTTGERMTFAAPVPEHFYSLVGRWRS